MFSEIARTVMKRFVKPRRVLLIEDSKTQRLLIAKKLTDEGYDVHPCDNWESAMLAARTQPYDCYVCDYELVKLTKEVRRASLRELAGMGPTIIYTAAPDQVEKEFHTMVVSKFESAGTGLIDRIRELVHAKLKLT